MTLKGTRSKKSHLLSVFNQLGVTDMPYTEIHWFDSIPGCNSDTEALSVGILLCCLRRFTFVSDQINETSMFSNTESMILYPGAATNIPKYDDLNAYLALIGGLDKSAFCTIR